MPADGDRYVISHGGEGDATGWVSPRPVDDVVLDAVTTATDLSADDLDDLDAYVDPADLAAQFDGDPGDEPLTFAVEDHTVAVAPDGTVDVDPG